MGILLFSTRGVEFEGENIGEMDASGGRTVL